MMDSLTLEKDTLTKPALHNLQADSAKWNRKKKKKSNDDHVCGRSTFHNRFVPLIIVMNG